MNKKEISERLDNIKIQIKSNDFKFRAHALNAFINLLSQNKIEYDLIDNIKPFLKENISDPYSSLKTDAIRASCFMILQNINKNEDLMEILLSELYDENMYRIEIILYAFSKLSNSNNKRFQEIIVEILRETPNIFGDSRFIPIIFDFWKEIFEQNPKFIDKYQKLIEKVLESYPEEFSDIRSFIFRKISDYNDYINEIKKKRREERELRGKKIESKQKVKTPLKNNRETISNTNYDEETKRIIEKKENRKKTTFSDLGFKRKTDSED
ncbi:MAG: hypothetical protein GF311_09685 [Candidatus Lokiarchaeota archaeon]|nr:hypothetical protein [Candidatus Lokiarchaeota archaeon]